MLTFLYFADSSQYADWGGSYPGGYGFSVTGFGIIDDYSDKPNYKGFSGYDNSLKNTGYSAHNAIGYDGAGYKGYYGSNNIGPGAHGAGGYSGSGYGTNGYGASGYGGSGYGGNGYEARGYPRSGYDSGYGSTGYIPNSLGPVQKGFHHSHGNGGYGGFGGNGGLDSYYGYNNPKYVGGGHLGYGYYKGNIYNNGVTPNLVTGYRGYTRR